MMSKLAPGAFSIAISIGVLLVIVYGLVGSSGNSYLTAAALAIPLATLVFARRSRLSELAFSPGDAAFIVLLIAIALSFLVNPFHSDLRGVAQLLISVLVGYGAARVVTYSDAPEIVDFLFKLSGLIVAIGTMAVAITFINSSNFWRPPVFGFYHAVHQFTVALVFFSLASVNRRLSRNVFLGCILLIGVSSFAYAASLVRFSIVAATAALALNLAMAPNRRAALCLAVYVLAAAGGYAARFDKAAVSWDDAMSTVAMTELVVSRSSSATSGYSQRPSNLTAAQAIMPSCNLAVFMENSVSIRKAIFADVIALLPNAGWFGYGLGSFGTLGCLAGFEVHNLFAQAVIEFGWPAGLALVALIGFPLVRLLPVARRDASVLAMLCIFVFLILIGLVHGDISRALATFAMAGALVGVGTDRGDQGHRPFKSRTS